MSTGRHNSDRAAACAAAIVTNARARATERAKHLPLGFARVLQRARENAGLTQEELAQQSGAPRAWVQRWDHGDASPRIDHLTRAPQSYRRAVVAHLASLDGDVVVQGPAIVHGTQSARLGSLLKELHEVLQAQHARLDCDSAETIEASVKELRDALVAITEAIAAESVELGRRRAGA